MQLHVKVSTGSMIEDKSEASTVLNGIACMQCCFHPFTQVLGCAFFGGADDLMGL